MQHQRSLAIPAHPSSAMRPAAAPQPLNAAQVACRELVLIDPAVASPEILLEGLRPGLEARLLCADEPAPAQIARAVAGRSLQAVHVIAHGQPGAVAFSGGLLDVQALEQHQQELAAIGAALGTTGQVLLWCCRTAASAAGTAFVEALAQITGVPVAASSSLVGAAARGGTWQLEGGDCSGAAAPLLPAAMARYLGVLISYSEQSGTANPFNGFDVGYFSTPSFADIDGDGDLDLVVGERDGNLNYYKNTGSATNPIYSLQSGTDNPLNSFDVGYRSTPSFADIDGDGDLDLVVGELYGNLNYYKNTGSATNPLYSEQSGTANPFNGFIVGISSTPSFADIDGDGDLDLVVGEYDGTLNYVLNVVCFLAGTLIATPTGERPIESLQPGDLITTAAGPQPVKFISRTRRHRNALLALGNPLCASTRGPSVCSAPAATPS